MTQQEKPVEQKIDEYLRLERTKAISSPENFVAYLKRMYETGDIIPDPENADSVMVNWRGILDDLWDMARQIGGDHPPPPMPRVEREAEAKSAIDLLRAWSAATATGTKPQAPEQSDVAGETQRALIAMGEDTAVKILVVAEHKDFTADQKCRAIAKLDERAFGWKSPKWAELLKPKVTADAIRGTDWWQNDRKEWLKDNKTDRK